MSNPRSLWLVSLFAVVGCPSDEELNDEAYHWDVSLVGVEDGCHEEAESALEEYTYSLLFDSSAVDLQIGTDTFARGEIAGCSLDYASSVVREDRGEGDEAYIQWQLSGEASVRLGGTGCDVEATALDLISDLPPPDWASLELDVEPQDLDWVGTETFRVLGLGEEITDLEVGCEYTMLVAGVYREGQE